MSPVISGGSSGGGAITVADGADVVEGATTDVAVTGDNAGTINAHLRGLTKDLGDPAALADATANPTRSGLAAFGMIWNGTTWDRAPGTTRGQWVEGGVAAGAADAGNPLKVGGRYNSTKPTLTDGQRGDAQLTTRGAMLATLMGSDSATPVDVSTGALRVYLTTSGASNVYNTPADTLSSAASAIQVTAMLENFNGTNYDRVRGNTEATLLASAARTATTSSADQVNYNGRGVMIVVNVTAEGGTTTLTLTVQGKDSISGNYYDLITGIVVYNAATDTPPTTRAVLIGPGYLNADAFGAGTADLIAAKAVTIPRTWRATITPSDATSQTYSVSGVTLL